MGPHEGGTCLAGQSRPRWTRLFDDERVRFIAVGAVNTAFGYAMFVLFEVLRGSRGSYLASLYLSYVIAILVAFLLHRHYTFRKTGTGNVGLDFLRFQGVYVVALAVNTAALPALVEVGHVVPVAAQAVVVAATTVISYFGHRLFSFRRPAKSTFASRD